MPISGWRGSRRKGGPVEFQRRMHFAGTWYPAGGGACEEAIRAFEAEMPGGSSGTDGEDHGADGEDPPSPPSRWGVVPHAGWVYSGRLAARVFRALPAETPGESPVDLVIVLGGHLRPEDPVLAMTEGSWQTPLGNLKIHRGFRADLESLPRIRFEDAHFHDPDNSVELQLPFVAHRFPQAKLLPLRVPPGPDALVLGRLLADCLERTGLNAVAVASTDLTHYGPNYGFEPHGRGEAGLRWVTTENDPAYIDAVTSGEGERILRVAAERHNACSSGAVAALNEIARRQGARFEPLAYATSSDIMPHDATNFVGYVGGVFR